MQQSVATADQHNRAAGDSRNASAWWSYLFPQDRAVATAADGARGSFLATPLTVCLVVLGKHTERLKFIDILLSDDPP
jgi:hypothetical protein